MIAVEAKSLDQIAAASGGRLVGPGLGVAARVCIDSRKVRPGDLFVALVGEHFDGHEFTADAARAGAVAVMVERRRLREGPPSPRIEVDDTRVALGKLGANYRSGFDLTCVAVGGSNGKTTTKELMVAVLKERFITLGNEASFNNDIGVPLSLLQLDRHHQVAVFEVGTNHPGELEPLLRMIRPGLGVITSIGREHLEFFGSLEGVVKEEGCIADCLSPAGVLFLNGDSEWAPQLAARCQGGVVKIGVAESNDWRVETLAMNENGTHFRIRCPHDAFDGDYHTKLVGAHQAINATFAVAVGSLLGIGAEEARRGIEGCESAKMRLQLKRVRGIWIFNDAYNANADSVLAALSTLRQFPCSGRRIAVLGDMAETGEFAVRAHREIGLAAAEAGVDALLGVGEMAAHVVESARTAGLSDAEAFFDLADATAALKSRLSAGDAVLIKASRSARLERIAEALGF